MNFLCIVSAIIFLNCSCYSQWIQQSSGTARDFLGIDMIDANTGYVCGDQVGSILKTTNSGVNWILYDEPTNDQYNGISFIDALTGLAVGPPGLVLRTSNGGINWTVIPRPGGDKGPVQFVSSTVAYAAGDDIVKSTDAGLTWSLILTGTLSQFQGLYFIDENTGTVVGRPGLIRTTTNGGATWVQRTMNLPVQFGDSTLFDVMYVNDLTGYACGNNGIVIKTTNGGINWEYKPIGALSSLKGVYFTDFNSGTVVGNTGRIMRTTDGGSNWVNQSLLSPLNSPLWGVDFVNQQTGWVVGFNGIIVKTTNGGFTGIEPISSEIPQNFELEQNYPNPFNPTTKIKFSIPLNAKSDATKVKLVVYDVLGREVESLVNEELKPGTYEVEWTALNNPSGIYIYGIISEDFAQTKKMVFIK